MLKKIIKHILYLLHIDITLNQKYDRQTIQIMRKILKSDSACIDIGCHKGEMLDVILELAPKGKHFAFEPIPSFYNLLKEKYNTSSSIIYPYALSNSKGTVTFNYVKNAPAYSGIKQRKYDISNPEIEKITVETETIDNLIPANQKINFIKIDVEGAEYGVLKGAVNTIKKSKPYIIFECGLGASDCYGTKPEEVFNLIADAGLKISLMIDFLQNKSSLKRDDFCRNYNERLNYYFIAHP